jgi:predicted phosphodiesterase
MSITVVCISDTHGLHGRIPPQNIPDGDLLIHAGDFTNTGEQNQIESFMLWFGSQPHRYKVLIAGNHDITLHELYYETSGRQRFHRNKGFSVSECRALVTNHPNVIYLEDSGTTLSFPGIGDVTVWGSPWQPEFCDWAFNLNRGTELQEKWALIPEGTDILITHGPPSGYGDRCEDGFRAGCEDLLATIRARVHPKLHVSGHIHEGYGVARDELNTCYVNASTCTFHYRPTNPAIVVQMAVSSALEDSVKEAK